MPSANGKVEKNMSTEALDPLRQAIVMVEHKIRNLEKRKAKLESYKEKQGKEKMSRDILEAVAKYDEVIHQLEMSREYVKQFTIICIDNDKQKKKAAKKEVLERTAVETGKIKQVLLIQDVLTNMGTEQVREDFLAGRNGAPALKEEELKFLDDLYVEVSPKHEGPVPFTTQVQKAAEFLLGIVDGKSKEVAGTTCAKLQAIVNSIQGCGYFDQPAPGTVVEGSEEAVQVLEEEVQEIPQELPVDELLAPVGAEVNHVDVPQQIAPLEVANVMAQPQGLTNNIPKPTPMLPHLTNIVPVSQVESNMYNAQGFKPPNPNLPPSVPIPVPNQQRPINDVMSRVGGNFTFFQDSELELGDNLANQGGQQPPSAIPSRTFTNQSFSGRPGPAPMAFQPPQPPAANPYFVGGFQPQAPPHYSPELMYPPGGPQPGQNVPPQASAVPIPTQLPTGDSSNIGYSQPQHLNAYNAQSNASSAPQPAAPAPQPFPQPPVVPSAEETLQLSNDVVNVDDPPPRQDWSASTDREDWMTPVTTTATPDTRTEAEWTEWNPQGTDGTKGSSKPRGDRQRSNYQGNKNGNRTSNYRPPRNRERDNVENNGGSNYYSNNTNGYHPRGDGQSRDGYQPRGDGQSRDGYQPRGDGYRGDGQSRGDNKYNKDGSYRRGPPQNRGPRNEDRGPRPERNDSRGDRPAPRDGAPRNNNSGGPRPQRNTFRGGPRQEANPVK